jgi:hypothetical protein
VKRSTIEWVAIILAAGISLAVTSLVLGVTVAAIKNGSTASTLSDNESQVLTAAFGGMIGVLGAWVGYRARDAHAAEAEENGWPEPLPNPHTALPNWPDRDKTVELPPDPPK